MQHCNLNNAITLKQGVDYIIRLLINMHLNVKPLNGKIGTCLL